MDRDDLYALHQRLTTRAYDLLKKKSQDYSEGGPFDNLMACEAMGLSTAEKGVLTRLMDKISRLNSITARGAALVTDEKIEDTLVDIINYAVIFGGVVCLKRERSQLSLTGSLEAPERENLPPAW